MRSLQTGEVARQQAPGCRTGRCTCPRRRIDFVTITAPLPPGPVIHVVRRRRAMPAMTTINRLRVLAVDGPRLTLHADHVCGGLTPDKNLLPSHSLALGLLMETTIDS